MGEQFIQFLSMMKFICNKTFLVLVFYNKLLHHKNKALYFLNMWSIIYLFAKKNHNILEIYD